MCGYLKKENTPHPSVLRRDAINRTSQSCTPLFISRNPFVLILLYSQLLPLLRRLQMSSALPSSWAQKDMEMYIHSDSLRVMVPPLDSSLNIPLLPSMRSAMYTKVSSVIFPEFP